MIYGDIDRVDKITRIALIGALIFLVIAFIIIARDSYYGYKYVDLDGNTGTAEVCKTSYGGMWCRSDGRQIMVREYWVNENDMEGEE